MNRLYFGDNLAWLRNRDDFLTESAELVYLEPPFNSNADYKNTSPLRAVGSDEPEAARSLFRETSGK